MQALIQDNCCNTCMKGFVRLARWQRNKQNCKTLVCDPHTSFWSHVTFAAASILRATQSHPPRDIGPVLTREGTRTADEHNSVCGRVRIGLPCLQKLGKRITFREYDEPVGWGFDRGVSEVLGHDIGLGDR